MNKKLHTFLFFLAVIIIIYLCKDKLFNLIEPYGGSSGLMGSLLENFRNLEPFGNQIVIHPDNASFEPQETTFSVLTYDSDLGSGVTQVSTCSDDSSWRNGDKTCLDYSLDGTNCEDLGDDGRLAFDACKVACDNCNTYTEVKRRLPSPIEDVDEPSYAQFEGSMSSGNVVSDIGGPDYREIIGKLDDLSGKIDSIEISSSSAGIDGSDGRDGSDGSGGSGGGTISQTCSSVTIQCSPGNLKSDQAFILATDTDGQVLKGENLRARCCEERQTEESSPTCRDVTCNDNSELIDDSQYMSISEITDDDAAKQTRCCKGRTGYCINNHDPNEDLNDNNCESGYTLTTDENKIKGNEGNAHNNCCDKTGFCGGNVDGAEGGFKGKCKFYEVKEDSGVGTTRKKCCKMEWWALPSWIILILFLIGISVYSFKEGKAWVSLGTITVISCFILFGFGVYNLVS